MLTLIPAYSPILAIGAVAERGRLGPLMVFVFVWSTIVYDPIACWTWNPNGWVFKLGGLDFAGGTPVHISSGTAGLALSIYLGKRRGFGTERLAYKPHNTTYVVLGTVFLWFGWFGFNGGSALSANLRAAEACIVTNLAASVGGLTWMLWDWRLEKKWSAVGFCSGAIAGLVAITPGSGFVNSPAAVLYGVMAGTICNFATQLKFVFRYDDCLDVSYLLLSLPVTLTHLHIRSSLLTPLAVLSVTCSQVSSHRPPSQTWTEVPPFQEAGSTTTTANSVSNSPIPYLVWLTPS